MGIKNFLIEGVSCAGKTSVCKELQRRGYKAINGDKELAYQGDPETGSQTEGLCHENHIWDLDKLETLIDSKDAPVAFFCGGSRNFSKFIHLFDNVFILDIDVDTLNKRLDERKDEWGSKPSERELILRLHQTKEDIPNSGITIDATKSLDQVVDEIIRLSKS